MRKLYSALFSAFLLISSLHVYAQTPQSIPYQAVARNSGGGTITNQLVSLRFSIHDVSATGTVVYKETQSVTTNSFGLFTVNIGTGTVVSGTFTTINWGTGGKYLQVELDATGGSSYIDMGTQQMMSVPYALYAEKSNVPGVAGPTGATGPQGPSGTLGAYGTGEAGALNITSNTDWTTTPPVSLNLQYTTINVSAGATLTVPSGTTLRVTGNVTISGTIVVAPGTSDNKTSKPHPGVAINSASAPYGATGITATAASQLIRIPTYGGGGGAITSANNTGGEGGGSLRIMANGTITLAAGSNIQANGRNAVNLNTPGQGVTGGGGGAGGLIVLLSKGTLTMNGTIAVNGGNGASGFDGNGGNSEGGGGGGGGGIIILAGPTISISGTSQTNGGAAGTNAGASGTINAGGGGGACGGNGGNGGQTTTTVSAGTAGRVIQITTATPETFTL